MEVRVYILQNMQTWSSGLKTVDNLIIIKNQNHVKVNTKLQLTKLTRFINSWIRSSLMLLTGIKV
jgi:hypothetical protein